MTTIFRPTTVLFVLAILWLVYFHTRYSALLSRSSQEDARRSFSSSDSLSTSSQERIVFGASSDRDPYVSPLPESSSVPLFFVSTANAQQPTQMTLLIRIAQALLFLGPKDIYWILVEEQQSPTTTDCSTTIRQFLLEYMAPENFPFAHLCPTSSGSETNNTSSTSSHVPLAALEVIQALGYGTNAIVFFGQASHLADVRFLNDLRAGQKCLDPNQKSSSRCRHQQPMMLSLVSIMPGKVHLIQGESWSSLPASFKKKKAGNNNTNNKQGGRRNNPHDARRPGQGISRPAAAAFLGKPQFPKTWKQRMNNN